MKDMNAAIRSNRRTNAMFCGHLALEKMIKALCVVRQKTIYREHNLLKLAIASGMNTTLSLIQQEELLTITSFNIEARYDDFKLRFQTICTPEYIDI